MVQLRLFLVTLCVLFVTACGNLFQEPEEPPIEIQTKVVVPSVPTNNLVCPAIPDIPDPDTATQRDIAILIPDLVDVAEHCKRDLGVVKRILEAAKAQAEAQNQTPVEP